MNGLRTLAGLSDELILAHFRAHPNPLVLELLERWADDRARLADALERARTAERQRDALDDARGREHGK